MVAAILDRGRVDITFSLQGLSTVEPQLVVNESVARQYHRCLQQLINDYGLDGTVTLRDMLTLRDVISFGRTAARYGCGVAVDQHCLDAALKDCDIMREKEGQALQAGSPRIA